MLRNQTLQAELINAINALQSRFNQTESSAIHLLSQTPEDKMANLATEINRQADVYESVAKTLIDEHKLCIEDAVIEIRWILADDHNSSTYLDRGYSTYLRINKLNPKYIANGFSQAVQTKFNSYHDNVITELNKEADYDLEAAKLNAIYQREHPKPKERTDAEKAQDLYDYTHQLIMKEVGIDAEQAMVAMQYIPTHEYNSVYHHLEGAKGFRTRFNTYADRIMSKTSLTYEEVVHFFMDVTYKKVNIRNTNYGTLFNDNEIDTILKFQPWHYTLLSKKTCEKYREEYPRKYTRSKINKTDVPACAPVILEFMPIIPNITSSVMNDRIGYRANLNATNTNTNFNILTSVGWIVAVIAVFTKILHQQSYCCFFNKKATNNRPKKIKYDSHGSESSEKLLHL
jgi:hypothetical protein